VTSDLIERLKLFVEGHRHKSRVLELNCRESGYITLSAEHHNEAVFAEQLLLELAKE
jgi:hypothetical protein